MKRTATAILCAAIAYELAALHNQRPGDTWSELFWSASRRPLVPFTLGLLAGHLVWQQLPDSPTPPDPTNP